MPTIWELDFYSRPIVDEQNKKVWEVLICESPAQIDRPLDSLFRYAQFCSSTQVNSIWLAEAIQAAIREAPHPPDKIRFFRQAMSNMITKACTDLGLDSQLSRRTYALNQWLTERMRSVYPHQLGYQASTNPSVSFATTPVQPLPDALVGEKWQFVTLEASAFDDMGEWAIDFGEAFPLGLANLSPGALVPGLLIYSARAVPLAAWLSGVELAGVKLEMEPAMRLILETGLNDRWLFAALPTAQLQAEAQRFETAKRQASGVHFLAVQADPNVEAFAGFWLLQEITLA